MDSPCSRSVGLHEHNELVSSRTFKTINSRNSLPQTPNRSPHPTLLTPSSSYSDFTPLPAIPSSPSSSSYNNSILPPTPSQHPSHLPQEVRQRPKRSHPPPSRRLFFPIRASLDLHTLPGHSISNNMASASISRPGSPSVRNLPMSPPYPELVPRPPSRCESLLRDTLRRADEQERSLAHRSASRSPSRWGTPSRRPSQSRARATRPRGNSFLSVSDGDNDENVFMPSRRSNNDLEAYKFLKHDPATLAAPRSMRPRITSTNGQMPHVFVYENEDYPRSPTSPSPMPPAMTRTRTAPVLQNIKQLQMCGEDSHSTRPPMGPRSSNDRRSYPNTVVHSKVNSNQSSPMLRHSTLPPHEYALQAKLESFFKEEKSAPSRGHKRALSHNVNVSTSPRQFDHSHSSASTSPQSLAPSSLSNSATDLARVVSSQPPSHERVFSYPRDNSSSSLQAYSNHSPPEPVNEPLTPPPTPPLTAFNVRSASEICKRIDGYVSFANVEGLGEPPGMDIDGDESEHEEGKWPKWQWLKVWPFANGQNNGQNTNDTSERGRHTLAGRKRSGSCVSK